MAKYLNDGYKFNHIDRTIILTREFEKKSNVYGSAEYKTIQRLNREFPTYVYASAPTHRKKSVRSHMTIAKMKKYIEAQPNSLELLTELDAVRFPETSADPAPFSIVKQWFFRKFPNYGKMPIFDEVGNIIPFPAPNTKTKDKNEEAYTPTAKAVGE